MEHSSSCLFKDSTAAAIQHLLQSQTQLFRMEGAWHVQSMESHTYTLESGYSPQEIQKQADLAKHQADLVKLQEDLVKIQKSAVPPFDIATPSKKTTPSGGFRWSSPPFYSHPGGYKMQLHVNMMTTEHAAAVVSIRIMKGEFDDNLKWPFRGSVMLQVKSVSETPLSMCITGEVYDTNREDGIRLGCGYVRRIQGDDNMYMQDNKLVFSISEIIVESK